jgi:hypothetical protein
MFIPGQAPGQSLHTTFTRMDAELNANDQIGTWNSTRDLLYSCKRDVEKDLLPAICVDPLEGCTIRTSYTGESQPPTEGVR